MQRYHSERVAVFQASLCYPPGQEGAWLDEVRRLSLQLPNPLSAAMHSIGMKCLAQVHASALWARPANDPSFGRSVCRGRGDWSERGAPCRSWLRNKKAQESPRPKMIEACSTFLITYHTHPEPLITLSVEGSRSIPPSQLHPSLFSRRE
jgi:hypothetical protein